MISPKQFLHTLFWVFRHLTNQFSVNVPYILNHHFRSYIKKGDVCLDIGAHAGAWSRPVSKLVGHSGQIYAFEAFPYYAQILKLTLKLLSVRNVKVLNYAVTDTNEPTTIIWKDTDGKRLTGLTHIVGKGEELKYAISVPGITLDAFVESENVTGCVSFVKGDVEGAELKMVQGAVTLIDEHRPVFYLEVCTEYFRRYGYHPNDLFVFFLDRHYRMFTLDEIGINPIDTNQHSGRGDVLFVPKEHYLLSEL